MVVARVWVEWMVVAWRWVLLALVLLARLLVLLLVVLVVVVVVVVVGWRRVAPREGGARVCTSSPRKKHSKRISNTGTLRASCRSPGAWLGACPCLSPCSCPFP